MFYLEANKSVIDVSLRLQSMCCNQSALPIFTALGNLSITTECDEKMGNIPDALTKKLLPQPKRILSTIQCRHSKHQWM